ncbi:MAG: UDP-N-acetylmuramoyl-L-alanine--D-glutamate ligase [Rhodoferax sp.]
MRESTVSTQAAPDFGLAGQRVLVLGLGASGLAMARWCERAGAQVLVADTRTHPPQRAALAEHCPGVRFVGGAFDAAALAAWQPQVVALSPGLAPALVAPVLEAARAASTSAGPQIVGELGLYAQALAALKPQGYAPQVLAVTGTNGKTTVTSLTGLLVERAGHSVAVAGNIGPSLLDTLAQRLDSGDLPAFWVLELSSFQLHGVQGFAPRVATVLNLTQDHLDWHADMADYAQAKGRIFGAGTVRVLNRDDPATLQWAPAPPTAPARGARGVKPPPAPDWVSFGSDVPQRARDWGLETVNGMTWLVRAQPDEQPTRRGQAPGWVLQRLMPADALRIRGRHNALNALAALALAHEAGCALAPMLYGLREYRGEPHRVQSLGWVRGVQYVDDSKGTNVGATVAAILGLGQTLQAPPGATTAAAKLLVILGGQGKGQDFAPLRAPLAQHARAVLLLGQDAPLIRQALDGLDVPLIDVPDMASAVTQAAARAQPGDVVLLSPACASLDMYRDYAQRAQAFVQAVQALADDAGETLEVGP